MVEMMKEGGATVEAMRKDLAISKAHAYATLALIHADALESGENFPYKNIDGKYILVSREKGEQLNAGKK